MFEYGMPRRKRSSAATALPPLRVDRRRSEPLYLQVARHLERAVTDGNLRPGDRLDGELGLAEAWGVSRATMRKAIEELVARGILVRRHGAGTQVMPQVSEGVRGGVEGLFNELKRRGEHPETKVLTYEVIPADEDIAAALWKKPGDMVLHLERLRLSNGRPMAIMRNWLSLSPEVVPHDALESVGLYEILRSAGIRMKLAQQTIGAEVAGAASARLLSVKRGSPVLSIQTTAFTDAGRPIDFGRHKYRGDLYRFAVTKVERRLSSDATA